MLMVVIWVSGQYPPLNLGGFDSELLGCVFRHVLQFPPPFYNWLVRQLPVIWVGLCFLPCTPVSSITCNSLVRQLPVIRVRLCFSL